jgi:hypothetical protein
MAYQLVHGKALVEGRIARPPDKAYNFMRSVPLLAHAINSDEPPDERVVMTQQLRLLADANVRYVVLHKTFLSQSNIDAWRDWFFLPPIYEDEQVLVMDTAVSLPTFTHQLTPQLGLVAITEPPATAQAGDWLSFTAHWGSVTAGNDAYDLCFNLVAANTISLGCQPLATDLPSDQWQANDLVHADYAVQISPFGPAGDYALQIQLIQAGAPVGEPATIGQLAVTALERDFVPPSPAETADLTWADTIHLIGYEATTTDNTLNLTLYWQAEKRPSTSYKLFVHVVEPVTSDIIAQADLIPGNWAFPTDWWEAGQFLSEPLTFPDLPAGDYEIWLGWYEPDSGERLLTTNGEDRVRLTAVTISP